MERAGDFIQGALNKVPGYKGYRDKEDRRDEDKRVRETVADAIVAVVDQLTAAGAQMAAARNYDVISPLEAETGQVRLLADRIRHASYGYGGIFTENSIDAGAIEQLRLFDAALLREVDGLQKATDTFTAAATTESLQAVSSERQRLTTLFNTRTDVVDSGRASQDEKTLELLAIPEKITPSPLLDVQRGDALSVLGDNYIANGTISLASGGGKIVLSRVTNDVSGAVWLLGSDISGIGSAKLVEGESSDASTATLATANANIDTAQGKQDDVAARYAYTDLGDGRVELTLAIGDSIKSYSGTTVNDKDVEVYSAR